MSDYKLALEAISAEYIGTKEQGSEDFILAEYIHECLKTFDAVDFQKNQEKKVV